MFQITRHTLAHIKTQTGTNSDKTKKSKSHKLTLQNNEKSNSQHSQKKIIQQATSKNTKIIIINPHKDRIPQNVADLQKIPENQKSRPKT